MRVLPPETEVKLIEIAETHASSAAQHNPNNWTRLYLEAFASSYSQLAKAVADPESVLEALKKD